MRRAADAFFGKAGRGLGSPMGFFCPVELWSFPDPDQGRPAAGATDCPGLLGVPPMLNRDFGRCELCQIYHGRRTGRSNRFDGMPLATRVTARWPHWVCRGFA